MHNTFGERGQLLLGRGWGVDVANIIVKWMYNVFWEMIKNLGINFFQKLIFLYLRENHYTMTVFKKFRPSIIKTGAQLFEG